MSYLNVFTFLTKTIFRRKIKPAAIAKRPAEKIGRAEEAGAAAKAGFTAIQARPTQPAGTEKRFQ